MVRCAMHECALYADPALYDRLFPEAQASESVLDESRRQRILDSERFYLEEAHRGGGPVLELGCGSGRLTIPIARSGVRIAGADLSEAMLSAARTKATAAGVAVDFLQADMRLFEIPERFGAIFIPGNSLLHLLTAHDLKACLGCVRRHLAPGGRLIFDVSHWDLAKLARDPAVRSFALSVQDPRRGVVTIEESAGYDAVEQIRSIQWYFSSADAADFRVIEYRLRVIFPQELLLLLENSGFRLEARYGEFPREPFTPVSPRQVCRCLPIS